MMTLKNKKILLGVSGGIAAYKSTLLIRRLREHGATVRVVMTAAAKQFITPLTLQALSENEVRDELFGLEAENAMSHIELARWADLVLIAPASANVIARLAVGLADDLLTTLCLATDTQVVLVPAMNVKMWSNSLTRDNVKKLQQHGFLILEPGTGAQACGEVGPGRLLEPEQVIDELKKIFHPQILHNKNVLITAGPTQEAIDPARYFTNYSSGKMGYALADAAISLGASVTLVTGPTNLKPPHTVTCIAVTTALEMHAAVQENLPKTNIFIGCAAVADYRPKHFHQHKLKKAGHDSLIIEMIPNPDIVAAVSLNKNRPECVVGFAAETNNLIDHAKKKLQAKNLDMIVANLVGKHTGFSNDQNEVTVITKDGNITNFPLMTKYELSINILTQIVKT